MTLRSKLLASFGAVTVVLLLPVLFAAGKLAEMRDFAVEGRAGHAATVVTLGRMQATMAELDLLERSLVATGDPRAGAAAEEAVASLHTDLGRLRASPYTEQVSTLGPVVAAMGLIAGRVGELMHEDRILAATAAFEQLRPVFDEAERRFTSVADSIDVLASRDFSRAEAVSVSGRRDTLAGVAAALLLAFLVAGSMTRSLTQPLRRLGRAMARVADGSFVTTDDLPYGRRDEIGDLAGSFQAMTHRLAELDRMKSEFLGVASHELKTPLNVINGYVELLEEADTSISSEHLGFLNGIAEQTQAMARLVSRLMDISRLEAGTYRMAWERIHLEDVVTGLSRVFETLAEQKKVALDFRILDSAPASLVLDVDIIRDEVLGNLLSNALKFTPPGERIELTVHGEEGGVVFTVTDSGPGIPPEHRDFIFEKHYRGDRSNAVGSGLGLAIAKEMVELHGGLITLEESEEGQGARFRVALPLTPPSPELEVPHASHALAGRLRPRKQRAGFPVASA